MQLDIEQENRKHIEDKKEMMSKRAQAAAEAEKDLKSKIDKQQKEIEILEELTKKSKKKKSNFSKGLVMIDEDDPDLQIEEAGDPLGSDKNILDVKVISGSLRESLINPVLGHQKMLSNCFTMVSMNFLQN